MHIRLTKISNQEHLLQIIRADGSSENETCNTRSLLEHDLLHLAIELEASLSTGFWGRLAAGTPLSVLNDRNSTGLPAAQKKLLMQVEQLVGAMTRLQLDADPDRVSEGIRSYLEQVGGPAHLVTPQFVSGVQKRLRSLRGHWRATPYGETMSLEWPEIAPQLYNDT